MTMLTLLLGLGVGIAVGRWLATRRAAAALAHAEAARVDREAEAYKAGCKDGREDVISIMPLLVAAQVCPADGDRACGDEPPYGR